MLYTKLPTSAIDFDDSVNGGVYGKYRPVSAYFWQWKKDANLRPVAQRTLELFARELVSIYEVKIPAR